jgi:hypothetical protein
MIVGVRYFVSIEAIVSHCHAEKNHTEKADM